MLKAAKTVRTRLEQRAAHSTDIPVSRTSQMGIDALWRKISQLRDIRRQDAAVIAELIVAEKGYLQARIDALEAGR